MPTTLKRESTRQTRPRKRAAAGRLTGGAALPAKPKGILGADEKTTVAKLRRRLADQGMESWLDVDDFRLKAGLR